MKNYKNIVVDWNLIDSPANIEKGDELGRPNQYQVLNSDPIWKYLPANIRYPFGSEGSLVDLFSAEDSLDHICQKTNFFVLFGFSDPEFVQDIVKRVGRRKIKLLIFEGDHFRFARVLQNHNLVDIIKLPRVHFFSGKKVFQKKPLRDFLDDRWFDSTPVFWIEKNRPDLRNEETSYIQRKIESYFFNFRILYIQLIAQSIPLREIKRGYFYDQQLHCYANIPELIRSPGVTHLQNCFPGIPAIIVGAGPSLSKNLGALAEVGDRAVIICTNTALNTLLKNNIEPHIVLMTDSLSIVYDRFLKGLTPRDAFFVASCPSPLYRVSEIPRKFVFYSYQPEIFGEKGFLDQGGAVATTGYSLAKLMGNNPIILIGADFSSPSNTTMAHSKDSYYDLKEREPNQVANPNMFPVDDIYGNTVYTNANFFSAAQWLDDEAIRDRHVDVINATEGGILKGPRIRILPLEEVSASFCTRGHSIREVLSERYTQKDATDFPKLKRFLENELKGLEKLNQSASGALRLITSDSGRDRIKTLRTIKSEFDQSGATFWVETSPKFNTKEFYKMIEDTNDSETIVSGFKIFFKSVAEVITTFLRVLRESRERVCTYKVGEVYFENTVPQRPIQQPYRMGSCASEFK